jgi:hypothetical protein
VLLVRAGVPLADFNQGGRQVPQPFGAGFSGAEVGDIQASCTLIAL